jgi:prepilin-type N-terminal cleavage/methylation domain-containing protein
MIRNIRAHAPSRRGFTLTEIAIVLGIIGLILGAVWAAASSVYANLKANQAQQGILSAAQAVRSMFATSANTGVVGNPATIASPGMFPTNWQSTTIGMVGNPWHINPTANFAYVYGQGQQFLVEIDGISDAGCAQLVGFYNQNAASQSGGSVPGLVGARITTAAPTAGTPSVATAVGAGPLPSASGATAPFSGGNAGYAPQPADCIGGGLSNNFAVFFDMAIM